MFIEICTLHGKWLIVVNLQTLQNIKLCKIFEHFSWSAARGQSFNTWITRVEIWENIFFLLTLKIFTLAWFRITLKNKMTRCEKNSVKKYKQILLPRFRLIVFKVKFRKCLQLNCHQW